MNQPEHGWAELLERGLAAKQQIANVVGGLISPDEAAALVNLSAQELERAIREHAILAVVHPDGAWELPRVQFAPDGRVRPGVAEFARASASLNPWVVLSILVDDVPDGSAILLERLDDPVVLADAVHRLDTYGQHVAA